ncbi:MAG: hypothetical protein V7784_08470 [Oceanospirillaceae bacterium]
MSNKLTNLLDKFAALDNLEQAAKDILQRDLICMKESAGNLLFSEGNICRGYVLLLSGTVVVQKVSEAG